MRYFNRYAIYPAILLVIAFLFVLSCWFFFWPIVECTYAYSWDPLLLGGIIKQVLFIIGGIIFIVAIFISGKIIL